MGHTDRAALIATVKQLWINANRLCDRQLGGTYESDCRLSLKRAEPAIDAIAALLEAEAWQPIATAPKGSWLTGPNDTRDPAYVEPPSLLLFTDDGICVGYADAYYAEGGWGFNGDSFWVSGGEQVTPTHWRPIPAPPVMEAKP